MQIKNLKLYKDLENLLLKVTIHIEISGYLKTKNKVRKMPWYLLNLDFYDEIIVS